MGARRAFGAFSVLIALVACSGAAKVGAPGTTTALPIASRPSPSQASKTDKERAEALVLVNDDLGSDWIGDSPGDGSIGDPTALVRGLESKFGGCSTRAELLAKTASTADGDYFTLAYGDTASLAQALVGSAASVFKTAATARRALSAAIDPAVVACTNRIVKIAIRNTFSALGVPGVTVSSAGFTIVPVRSGAEQAGALLFSSKIAYAGQTESVYLKLIEIRQGRALVTMYLEDQGTPFPVALERALIDKIVARLRADGGR